MVALGQGQQILWRNPFSRHYAVIGHVRDTAVLAKFAGKIAPGTANGKNFAARQKMVQGLFFYRVHGRSRYNLADQRSQLAAHIDAHPANALGPVAQTAPMRAQTAHNGSVRLRIPQRCKHA